jgi:hypothetical protein
VDNPASRPGIGKNLPFHSWGVELDGTRRFLSSYHWHDHGWGSAMQGYQWFLLGVMAAWTPGLVVLALALRQNSIDQGSADNSSRHCGR